MPFVAPSILSADFAHLADELDSVLDVGVEFIHVDVMDGRFVPNLTIGPLVVEAVRRVTQDRAQIDVHLMIVEPERYIEAFRAAGADIITVHAEAVTHLHRVIQQIHSVGAQAGVALNPHTSPEVIDYVLDELDLVLVMSVNPGFGGQVLIESAYRKLSALRDRCAARGLKVLLEVDGGVKPSNARRFAEAGATVLVSGSGIFQAEDREAAINAIRCY